MHLLKQSKEPLGILWDWRPQFTAGANSTSLYVTLRNPRLSGLSLTRTDGFEGVSGIDPTCGFIDVREAFLCVRFKANGECHKLLQGGLR